MGFKEDLSQGWDQEKLWQKYCGFFDLSLGEFMEIQERLLLDQIEQIHGSPLAGKLMTGKPGDISEFRRLVPLTTFDDYAAYLNGKNEDVLAVKPYCWGHTSGRGGIFKWVPYTERSLENFVLLGTTLLVLACTSRKGEINVENRARTLQNLPPPPYMAGILNRLMEEKTGVRIIPPIDKYENVDFETKLRDGFQMALRDGVDVLTSLTSVLVKMGERFTESSGQMTFNRGMLHPRILWRLVRAVLWSKREGRGILPKDLWPLKGLICYGTDTGIYREKLRYYWGREPLENYAATESGLIAMQAWNKKSMTFIPSSCFLEFIPEQEWLKSREDKGYQPPTVLLDEVQLGERYEIIITSFYGMPFLRYRLGDLVRIVALEDEEAGIMLPQMVFESRADDLIDIAGFPRLDERTVWQAIVNTGVKYEDWSARKEYDRNEPVIRLYIELKEESDVTELERIIHQELVSLNRDYRDLEGMLGIRPLRIKPVPAGSFQRYLEEKQKAGYDLAYLKPQHMNAPDSVIHDLIG